METCQWVEFVWIECIIDLNVTFDRKKPLRFENLYLTLMEIMNEMFECINEKETFEWSACWILEFLSGKISFLFCDCKTQEVLQAVIIISQVFYQVDKMCAFWERMIVCCLDVYNIPIVWVLWYH